MMTSPKLNGQCISPQETAPLAFHRHSIVRSKMVIKHGIKDVDVSGRAEITRVVLSGAVLPNTSIRNVNFTADVVETK